MKKTFKSDIENINQNIREAEQLLSESMNFYEDDSIDEPDMSDDMHDDSDMGEDVVEEPEMGEEVSNSNIDSYVDHIRKYALNGLSALCDSPESEEYQMLKKIFQMCDKKPEKKDGINESHRLFGVLKHNKKVVFETRVKNTKDFKSLKNALISETISKGYKPSDIRLVSESKIIL